jgi:pimeloyl-ACP methyl ester carboxylesterase
MQSVTTPDGARIRFREIGSGPPIVLLHGINLDHTVWGPSMALLQERFRLVAIDLRGHGASDKPGCAYSYTTLAADVGTVIAALGIEDEAVLAGWSFGGAVALRYALDASRPPRGLALIAAAVPRMVESDSWPRGVAPEDAEAAINRELSAEWPTARRAVLERMFAEPPNEETLDWLWSASIKTPPWVAAACRRTLYAADFRKELPSLGVRTLLVHGTADPIVPIAGAEVAQTGISGSRLVTFEECGHAPQLEQLTKFSQLLTEFATERQDGK